MAQRVTYDDAMHLLERLIATPSHSRQEQATADVLYDFLTQRGVEARRHLNNVWAIQPHHNPQLPTLMLNSHHDTVRPSQSYTVEPYEPLHRNGKLYGLGSNDAGASLVALVALFCNNYTAELPFNLVLALSAEEEVSGVNGVRALLKELKEQDIRCDMAIVGEPTQMQAAIAERGLMVWECEAEGRSGHAARNEGENALYKALEDIELLRNFRFDRSSELLGEIKLTVTQIEAGVQHNIIPDRCRFVVDVRTTDAYTNEEVVELLAEKMQSTVSPRSTHIRAAVISMEHPLTRAAIAVGCDTFISPTTSDRTLMDFPALKIGIGDSARSHTADEFIYEAELAEGMERYEAILEQLKRFI